MPRSIYLGVLFLTMIYGGLSSVRGDEPTSTISLVGVPAPYCFERICKLRWGDLWIVGGSGEIQSISAQGTVRKQRILNVDLNGVFFLNSSRGWVVGEQGVIVHTRDRGFLWNRQRSGTKETINAITCTDEKHCWAVGEKGLILRTLDAGKHWRRVGPSDVSVHLFAVSFIDHRIGWVVGQEGFILRTVNGGRSWEKQRAIMMLFSNGPFRQASNLLAVEFLDKITGWVGGMGGVARTTDGGKSWSVEQIEGTFIGLVSPTPNVIWAINKQGTNYISKDGGSTWMASRSQCVKQAAKE